MIRNARNLLAWSLLIAATATGAAELRGSITDGNGQALPGVNIVVVDVDSSPVAGAVSGADGEYVVIGLPVGSYALRVTHIGYRAITRSDVQVGAAGERVDISLESAIIGYTVNQHHAHVAVYSYQKCIEVLVARDGMTHEEADEFLQFNTLGAYVGENGPLFIHEATQCD